MRWLVALLLAVTPVALWPTPAAAQYCPGEFHLAFVVDRADTAIDRNENGVVCVKQHVTGAGNADVPVDDGVPLQQWRSGHMISQ